VVNRRGVLAAVLGLVYPGLGHVYLRRWLRALAWFALALATAVLVVPPSAIEAFDTQGIQGLVEASKSFGPEVTLSLLAVRALNVADAYLVAVRDAAAKAAADAMSGDEAAENCPSCGGELDQELDFCPWCTMRFQRDADEESEENAA
jgi:uncharacterized paraquat-inducible protein A